MAYRNTSRWAFFQPNFSLFPFTNYRKIRMIRIRKGGSWADPHYLFTPNPPDCAEVLSNERQDWNWTCSTGGEVQDISPCRCAWRSCAYFPVLQVHLTADHTDHSTPTCKIPSSRSVPRIIAALAPAQRTNVLFLPKATIPNTLFGFSPF